MTGYPIVRFSSGLEVSVGVEKYTAKTGGGLVLTRRQIPLQLAWAVSIHKSQVYNTIIVATRQSLFCVC